MSVMPQTDARVASESYFSHTYSEARSRFLAAAKNVDAEILSYQIDAKSPDDLSIDVAILGAEGKDCILVSSGVHGVEGFLGSAIQLAWLERLHKERSRPEVRYVLIHSLNPFGYSRLRRCNEDNVDLNRNFLREDEGYSGATAGYVDLNHLLNRESPPSRLEPFTLWAVWNIWRKGLQPLKQAIAEGQYEYPRGLFFGGGGPSQSTRIVREHCDRWLASSPTTVHIDIHSGLGSFGSYKLLLGARDSADHAWYDETFGTQAVEPLSHKDQTAYSVRGQFGAWMQHHFAAGIYRFVNAEFGTYGPIRMLKALRAENRAHHFGQEGTTYYARSKERLLECFCPQSAAWRRNAVESGIHIIEQAKQALLR